jgi:hypothetical protein
MLYHGTGARRAQSIRERGLLPGPRNTFVYATTWDDIAKMFAAVRAFEENDSGLIVSFPKTGAWGYDSSFPWSLRSRTPIPRELLTLEIIRRGDLEEAYEKARERSISIERVKDLVPRPSRSPLVAP